ncbi:protein-associating with the carboxyl-terminal domain of ezrin-like [Ptychodera flava]|uniref:protein-associating with the carboxyl-terminal domain of ezrin-like n=1 Tax=Ptychodera flava TaxID=63121 RepID=UPI00396A7F3D
MTRGIRQISKSQYVDYRGSTISTTQESLWTFEEAENTDMGTEASILQGCDLEEPFETSQQDWKIHPAKRNDGSRVSVFFHKKQNREQTSDKRLENAARQLKILRHPTILKFFDSCNNVEGTYLITELVKPLELVLDTLTSEEICAGMYNVIEALSFLHERGGVSHNNICMSSIYVSQDGGWRLGGMEHLCKFHEATVQFLEQMCPLRDPKFVPPEEKEKKVSSTSPDFGHARDAYAFGILAQQLLEYLTELGDMTTDFSAAIEDGFLNPEPTLRPKLNTLLTDRLFKNYFLEIIKFLNNITIKEEAEKITFFKGLVSKILTLPTDLIASRLVPKLLTRFVMAEASAAEYVYPHLFTPNTEPSEDVVFKDNEVNPILPVKAYKESVIPILQKIFLVRETHVRLTLLKYFPLYVNLVDPDVLRKTIMPQLLLGLRDTNDDIVSASLRALGDVVPILGGKIVVGGERHKYFLDGRPKFQKQKKAFHSGGKVFNLTAVSGVINLPKITKPVRSHDDNIPGSQGNKETGNQGNKERDLDASVQEAREKRRQELKRKSEERRQERERRKQEQQKKVTLATEVLHDVSFADQWTEEEDQPQEGATLIEDKSEQNATELTERDSSDIDMDTKKVDFQEEEDNWSDWGDMEQTELANTETAAESKAVKEEKNDWSNWDDGKEENVAHGQMAAKSKGGSLKLKIGGKGDKESKPQKTVPKSPTSPAGHVKSPRSPKSPQGASSKGTTQEGGRNVTPKDLGEGYAIPNITAKLPDPEPDFFADMVPTVKPNIVRLDELNTTQSASSKAKTFLKSSPQTSNTTTVNTTSSQITKTEREAIEAEIEAELSASFAAVETTDDVEAGWGDDDLDLDVEVDEQ